MGVSAYSTLEEYCFWCGAQDVRSQQCLGPIFTQGLGHDIPSAVGAVHPAKGVQGVEAHVFVINVREQTVGLQVAPLRPLERPCKRRPGAAHGQS